MNHKVIKLIEEYQMLSPCDHVVAGVSGGADSLALLHFLRFGCGMELKLTAVHLNHLLRGEESLRDQHHVEEICEAWGVRLVVRQADIAVLAKQSGIGLEEAGREARYRLFEEIAGADGKIATAHTLSDCCETLIFQLARGTGLRGLCGIPPVRGQIVRPFLCVTRAEIEQYCRENGIKYITDSSNHDDLYNRNRIRHQIIPKLKELNPRAEESIGQLLETLREDEACLERLAAENAKECRTEEGILLEKLSKEAAVRKRVLMGWLRESHVFYDFQIIDRISDIAAEGRGKINLCGNLFCEAKEGCLLLYRPEAATPYFEFPLELRTYHLPSGDDYSFYEVDRDRFLHIKELFKNSTYNYIDSSKIIGKLKIRQRRNGDKFCIFPRNITKSIKKLCQEAKISPQMREKIFLICDERGIIYVEGLGVASRVAADETTTRYLMIKKERTGHEK